MVMPLKIRATVTKNLAARRGEVKRGNLCMEQGQIEESPRASTIRAGVTAALTLMHMLEARCHPHRSDPRVGRKSPSGNRGSQADGHLFAQAKEQNSAYVAHLI